MHNAIRAFSIFSALFLTTLPLLAQAPPCRPGTMANVVGTSCSVGQLTFNFKDDFFGSSFVETNGSTVFTPVPPAGVGFIPVSAGSQVGFKLVFNFVDNPRGADNTSAADHFIQFSYSSQSAPQTEIRSQSISMEAAAQNAPGNFVFVNVGDFQIYPNNPIAVVNDPSIDIENGVTIFNQLTSNQFLEIPGTQSTGNFLGTKTTQIFDEATGFASASLTSATFLFTLEPVVPTPPPASLSYSTIDLPGVAATFVSNITNSGRTVGSYLDAAGIFHAYVAEPDGTFSTIDVPGSTSTVGFSLNEHGDVAGDYTDPAGGTHGFFQHDGVITTFDFPNSLQTEVGAIKIKARLMESINLPMVGFTAFCSTKVCSPPLTMAQALACSPQPVLSELTMPGKSQASSLIRIACVVSSRKAVLSSRLMSPAREIPSLNPSTILATLSDSTTSFSGLEGSFFPRENSFPLISPAGT